MGRQYEKFHATTVVASAVVAANRFVSYAGGYANQATRVYDSADCLGVSEHAAAIGEAMSVITGFSALVEAGEAIGAGLPVTVGANGVAMLGTAAAHVGRTLEAAGGAGALVEVRLLPALHPTA